MYTDIATGIFIWSITLSPLLFIVVLIINNIDKNKKEQARWNSMNKEQQEAELNHKREMDVEKRKQELKEAYDNGYAAGYGDCVAKLLDEELKRLMEETRKRREQEKQKFEHDVEMEMYRQRVYNAAKNRMT